MPGWEDLSPTLQRRIHALRTALLALSQTTAGEMEATLKSEAPWDDRTGNARNTLHARASVLDANPNEWTVGIVAAHGMQYGVWLETKQNQYVWGRGPYPFRQVTVSEGGESITGPWTMVLRPVAARYNQRYQEQARQLAQRAFGGGQP